MEKESALDAAYRKLKTRWCIFLFTLLLGAVWLVLSIRFEAFTFILGLTCLVFWILCYVSQFLVIREMSDRVGHPRVDGKERGFWYTAMLGSLLVLGPGTVLEVGIFLLYARKFISNAQIADATGRP